MRRARRRRRSSELPLRHAIALGALHGPAELLPVSSSAHVTLIPWLLGWPYPDLDPELRKAFEVVLLAGAAAMAIADLRGGQERRREQANALDALALGLAQACALVPGASRNGMT